VALTRRDHFEAQIVVVAANFADCHSCKTSLDGVC
jgi:hypothetical protein